MKSHPCVKTPWGGVSMPSEPISKSVCESVTSEPVTFQPATTSVSLTSESQPATFQPATCERAFSERAFLARCRHINRRGHRCRLFSAIPNLELCPHHSRQLQKQEQRHNDDSAAELLGDLTDFSTPDAVNALLGNLVRQLARKRIARLDAIAIAYVSQLLLGSIAALDRRDALGLNSDDDAHIGPFSFAPPASDQTTSAAPISDSARVAALFATEPTQPQPKERRA